MTESVLTFQVRQQLNTRFMENKTIFEEIDEVKKIVKENFVYINNVKDIPSTKGGSAAEKIYTNPTKVFHFLEFIFECSYIDLDKEQGYIFIDDKVSWEFLFKTDAGYIRVYDWKGYSVSLGVAEDLNSNPGLRDKVNLLKRIIEDNLEKLSEFRKRESKKFLDEWPLDNFMQALASQHFLFNISLEANKKGFGLLESLVLYVGLIDTMLRYSILLVRINKRKSKKIEPDLKELYCQKGAKYISEREIFTLAKKEVDFLNYDKEKFFADVNDLYDLRNKAVHRYAITNFQYSEVREALDQYIGLKNILSEVMIALEKEQVELGVGFLTKESLELPNEDAKKEILQSLERKVYPSVIIKETPKREAMFSDKYRAGIHPKLRKVFNKIRRTGKKK